jgi:hypothetical protein
MRAPWIICAGAIAAAAIISTGLPASAAATHAAAARPSTTTVQRGGMYYDPPVAIVGKPAGGQVGVLLADGVKISVPAAEEALIVRAIHNPSLHVRMAADDASVRAGTAAAATYHSYKDTIHGNCGSSFIQIADKSKRNVHPVKMTTGFSVNEPAVSYAWFTDTFRNASGFKKPWKASGGLLLRKSWSGGFTTILNYRHGVYTGLVYAGVSQAVLVNGDVCVSGGPIVAGYL